MLASESLDCCTELTELNLAYNSLKHIAVNVFQRLSNLKHLKLYNNDFTFFPEESLRPLRKLVALDLDSNFIYEIKENVIFNHCPNLEKFWVNDNNILCHRVVSIKRTVGLIKNGLHLPTSLISKRTRTHKTYSLDGIICLLEDE